MGAFGSGQHHGFAGMPGRWFIQFTAKAFDSILDDHGAVDDNRNRRGHGNFGVLYRSHHHCFCVDRRKVWKSSPAAAAAAIQNLLDLIPAVASFRRNGLLKSCVLPICAVAMWWWDRGFQSTARLLVGIPSSTRSITGESPMEKLPGAAVYAGTIDQSGVLEIKATERQYEYRLRENH